MTGRNLDQHVHIVGPPRSGTTQLYEIVRACYGWDYAPTGKTGFLEALPRRHGRALTRSADPSDLGAAVAAHRTWIFYCLRDPRDTICSRDGSDRSRYWTSLKHYRQTRQALFPHEHCPNVLIVKYEDLAAYPDGVQARIEAELGWLRPRGRFSGRGDDFAATPPGTGPIVRPRSGARAGVGRWQRHLPRIAGEIERFGPIDDLLMRDGYELDGTWAVVLGGVIPDTSYSGMELKSRRLATPAPRRPLLKRALRRLGLR